MRTSHAHARRLPVAIALTCLIIASGAAEATDLGDLAWIAGSWITDPGELRFEEHWTQPAENALLGMSRTLAGDRMVFFEYLRIEADGDALFYVAQPRGKPPTRFRLTSWDGSEAIFENPEHDSPKRIRYRRNADGSMTAEIDDGPGTEPKTFTFRPLRDK